MPFFLETPSSLGLLPKILWISSAWGLAKFDFCLYDK